MKKIISIIAVLSLLLAGIPAVTPVRAVAGTVDEVDALYFDVKPVIDGIVTEEEWGESSVYVDQMDAATIFDTEPVNNRFFYRNPAAVPGFDEENLNMSYEMWLRWDEDYYYVAVKVFDPDGHSLKNGRNFTWNGDAFQMRVDPLGYNASSAVGPELYDAELDGTPWSRDDIDDLCFGFVEAAGGFSEAWETVSNNGITPFLGGSCNISVAPAGVEYTQDTLDGVTTYEIALPWNYIDSYTHNYTQHSYKNPTGAIGREYGMSAVVYNANGEFGQASWNAGLSWGSGIIRAQQNEYTKTCAGSNKIVLSGDKVSEDPAYTGTYQSNPGGYIPVPAPVNYPREIDESTYVFLDYEDPSDYYVYGYDINGELGLDTDGQNHVILWDRDTGYGPNSPTESGLNENNYLSTQTDYQSKGCSYTMEFDVKVTGVENFEEGYFCQLYNWFGGSSTVDYECGYNFDTGKFNITDTSSKKVIAEVPGTFTLNEWHHWVFQYFKDTCEIRFYFDPEMEGGIVSPRAAPIFRMSYRYFDCTGVEQCELIFRRFNCQIMMDNIRFYNFVDFSRPAPVKKVFGDANGDGSLDMKDVLLMRKVIAGIEDIHNLTLANADVYVDGVVDMKDVLLIRSVIAGLEEPRYHYIIPIIDAPNPDI